jgi:uncharacterized pyridoxal phosphate-dependent enzyme
MDFRQEHPFSTIINARGTFTPLGVSRSSSAVRAAVSDALSEFINLDEMQDVASRVLAVHCGAEAGTVVHCGAAAITLAVAATMTGTSPERIARLPDTQGMPNRVVLPAIHAVNYGQAIEQAIRLAGARPILAGDDAACRPTQIEHAVECAGTSCLLLVSSRLTKGARIDFKAAIAIAHKHGIPAIIDGAAQDFRMHDLLQTGADLLIVSAQKYLGGPTAGLLVGRQTMVAAVRAQEKGIGRAMKASKEAIAGALVAIRERSRMDETAWQAEQRRKITGFLTLANTIAGVEARAEPDPTGLPFERAHLNIDPAITHMHATELVAALRNGPVPIWVMDYHVGVGEIVLELVQTRQDEIETIAGRLRQLLEPRPATGG